MAYPPETRLKARTAYVRDLLPLDKIAVRLGVGERTLARWKAEALEDGDDWDKGRTAGRLSSENLEAMSQVLLEQFLVLHQATLEEVKQDKDMKAADKVDAITRLADAFTKTMKAVSRSAPRLSQLAIAGDVLQKLGRFVAERYPEEARALLPILEPFGAELVKAYGQQD